MDALIVDTVEYALSMVDDYQCTTSLVIHE